MKDELIALTLDCHAYAWHEVDETGFYAECGPDNLVRMAEEFGILIRFVGVGFGWEYNVAGPRDHVVRFLTAEYCGEEEWAREMVEHPYATVVDSPAEALEWVMS